jgi:HEAT repeat protein
MAHKTKLGLAGVIFALLCCTRVFAAELDNDEFYAKWRQNLSSEDEGKRRTAAMLLGAKGDPAAIPMLKEILKEGPSAGRAVALDRLQRCNDPEYVWDLIRDLDPSKATYDIELSRMMSLGAKNARSPEDWAWVLQGARNPMEEAGGIVAWELGQYGNPPAIPEIEKVIADASAPAKAREALLVGMRDIMLKDAVRALREAGASANDAGVQKRASELIAEIEAAAGLGQPKMKAADKAAVPLTEEARKKYQDILAGDYALKEKVDAVHAIGRAKDKESVDALIKVLETSKEERLVGEAVVVLGMIGDARALPSIQKLTTSSDRGVAAISKVVAEALEKGEPIKFPRE